MIVTRKIDEDAWTVFACGIEVGTVYYDREAWSGYRYFIQGGRRAKIWGGVNSKTQKYAGWCNLRAAAIEVSIMNSGKVIAAMP